MDDELPGLNYLKTLCLGIGDLEVVKTFNRAEKVIAEHHSISYDLCFLDIEMPGISGIKLAKVLGKPVIFTTAYKEFAADAFEIDAIDYLVKPIRKDRFIKAVEKARLYLKNRQSGDLIWVNTDRGKTLIDFTKVVLITVGNVDSRDKHLMLHNGESFLLKNYSFSGIKEIAGNNHFVQVNKKQMISVKNVESYTYNQVVLKMGKQTIAINLSNSFRRDFIRSIQG